MWHRYDSALRGAVVLALKIAGARGASAATARDLVDAIAATEGTQASKLLQNAEGTGRVREIPDAAPAREMSDNAMAALEVAYEEAARNGSKQISCEHVLVGLIE